MSLNPKQNIRVDLNADLGEHEDDYIKLLPLITSGNFAAGGHAGGGQLLENALQAGTENGVLIGAHPSYPDLENFGRLSHWGTVERADLKDSIVSQIRLVADTAAKFDRSLSHIKAHGALYNDAMANPDVAEFFIDAVTEAYPEGIPLFGMPGSVFQQITEDYGFTFIGEGFTDRAYTPSLSLASRTQPGSVLEVDAAFTQAIRMVTKQEVVTLDGKVHPIQVDTVCVHADTPGAAAVVERLGSELKTLGVSVQGFRGGVLRRPETH